MEKFQGKLLEGKYSKRILFEIFRLIVNFITLENEHLVEVLETKGIFINGFLIIFVYLLVELEVLEFLFYFRNYMLNINGDQSS